MLQHYCMRFKFYFFAFLLLSFELKSSEEAIVEINKSSDILTNREMEINIPRQGVIIGKMAAFLQSEPTAESEGQLRVIKGLIDSKGECAGLSSFWVLCKRIADEPNPHNKPRDDIHFFKKVVQLLLTKVPDLGQEKSSDTKDTALLALTELEKKAIRRFIGHVLFFQKEAHEFTKYKTVAGKHGPNVDIAVAYNYLTGKNLIEMVGLNPLICTKEILKARLKVMIRPGVLITIATNPIVSTQTGSHATVLYQSRDGKITYYDPNSGEKHYIIPADEESAEQVFDRIASDIFESTSLESNPMRISMVDRYFRVLPIFAYRFEKDNMQSYDDLNLSFKEKESIREHFLIKEGIVDKNLKDTIDAAPVYVQDLKKELSKQHALYEKLPRGVDGVNDFMEQLVLKIIGLEKYTNIPFLKSIKESDLFTCAKEVTELVRNGYGIRAVHIQYLTEISRNKLTYWFNEDNTYDLISTINLASYFRDLTHPPLYKPLYQDIRNLFKDNSSLIDADVRDRIEQKSMGYESDMPYIRERKDNTYNGAIGYALRSNYPKVADFLLNDVNPRHLIDSENSGKAIFYSIQKLKDTIQNIKEALEVMLSESVRDESKPSLFWIAASIKEVLIQKSQLPTQIKSRNISDLKEKMKHLNVMEKMLSDHLDRRLLAGEKLTKEEESVVGALSYNRIERP